MKERAEQTNRNWGVLASLLAVVVAVFCVLVALRADPARAYAPGTWTPEEERIFNGLQKDSNAADLVRSRGGVPTPETEEAQKVARRVLTRSTRKALPRLAPHLITKGGLAGVAAGVWIHNGVAIYNVQKCGQMDCPEPLVLDAEFKQAEELTMQGGASGAIFKRYDGADVTASGMVLSIGREYSPGLGCRINAEWAVRFSPGERYHAGVVGTSGEGDGESCGYGWYVGPNSGTIGDTGYTGDVINNPSGTYFYTVDMGGPRSGERKRFGPTCKANASCGWRNPVYDAGASKVEARQPGEGDLKLNMDEGKALIDAVEGDEEYRAIWAKPWLDPDFKTPKDPAERERLWGPVTKRYYDGGWQCEERQYGTVICEHDGNTYVEIKRDWIAWAEYNDGTKEILIDPKDKPAAGTAEHPWGNPDREIEPDGNPGDDERHFGPGIRRNPNPDDPGDTEFWIFEDDTIAIYHKGTIGGNDYNGYGFYVNGNRVIERDLDGTITRGPYGQKLFGGAPVCDEPNENVYETKYPDGVVVKRAYPAGVPREQTHNTDAICEAWTAPDGSPMQPDPAKYPKPVLKDYRKTHPELFQ